MKNNNYTFRNKDAKYFSEKIMHGLSYLGGDGELIINRSFKEVVDICFMNGLLLKCDIKNDKMEYINNG